MLRYIFLLLFPLACLCGVSYEMKLNTLYHGLDSHSISEHFAFYHLYPETEQGEKALNRAWDLLNTHNPSPKKLLKEKLNLPAMEIDGILSLVNKQPFKPLVTLSEEELCFIESISKHLNNRTLAGYKIWEKKDLISLENEEVDLSRALLLHQFEKDKNKIRQYEATIDLMALQILAYLPKNATDKDKIDAINTFIFYKQHFRFPPHSLWAKEIDTYTFLPSVLDNRQGVCLGVSILYLSLAQRLDLPLEIITPPGHIYLSYKGEINIETTARGISIPSKNYLGINTCFLQKRELKEVIGLSLMNQASTYWQKEDYTKTVALYEEALDFLPEDSLLKLLLGYNYLFINEKKKGKTLLKSLKNTSLEGLIYKETTPEDFFNHQVSAEGIKAIFLPVDKTRSSILEKQKKLQEVLKKYPKFREGFFQLATTYLQLGRDQEALNILNRYHIIDPNNPTVEYYLTILCMQRFQYEKGWKHLKNSQRITSHQEHHPTCLKELYHHLRTLLPDPDSEDLNK